MNFKTTISLLVLLAIIAGGSYFLGVFSPKSKAENQKKAPVVQADKILLIAPSIGDVQRVKLEVAGRDTMVFERSGQSWKIVQPVDAMAMSWEVSDLIDAFAAARKLETFVPGQGQYADQTLESLGLKEPIFTVTLEETNRKMTYQVGQNPVASESTYVKTPESNEVYVIDQDLRSRIKKNVADYRDKQLWELNKANLSELKFVSGDGKEFKFVKTGDGKWTMVSPVKAAVSIGSVTEAINAVTTLKAQEFVEDAPANLDGFGLSKPAWTITAVETQEVKPTPLSTQATQPASAPAVKRTEHVLLIGGASGLKSDQVYAKPADKKWVVTIAQDNLKKIIPDVIAWREKTLVELNKDALTRIDIRRSAQDAILFRENENWKLQATEGVISADPAAVNTLIDAINGLQATSFIDMPSAEVLKKSKLDEPACTIILAGTNTEPVVLTIGGQTPSGMFRYVKRSNQDYIAVVANEKVEKLFTPALSYRDRQMMVFSIDSVTSIEVNQHNRIYTIVRPGPGLPWKVTSPIEAPADQQNVRNVLLALATLRAEDYVAQGYLGNYNLSSPQVQVKVKVEMQVPVVQVDPTTSAPTTQTQPAMRTVSQEYTLAVSKHNDKVYAVRPAVEKPLVALVSDQLLKDLSAEFVARSVFANNVPKPEIVNRLEIKKTGGETIVLEKVNGVWMFPTDAVVKIDQEKINNLLQKFASLKAICYSDFQDSKSSYGLDKPILTITASDGKNSWTLNAGGQARGQNRYGQSSSLPWIFELPASDVTKLSPALKDLIAPVEPASAPEAEPITSVNN
jgi:hypothetical protein